MERESLHFCSNKVFQKDIHNKYKSNQKDGSFIVYITNAMFSCDTPVDLKIVIAYNMTSDLKIINSHSRDPHIVFDEVPHTYYIDGSSEGYISCTTFIHSFFGKFDAQKIAERLVTGNNPKYKNKQVDDIIEEWEKNRDEAALAGTKMHKNIEDAYNQKNVVDDSPEYAMFLKFLSDWSQMVAYRTEWEIYDEELKIAGSIDMIFRDDDGKFHIADWKRSKEIKKSNKFQKGTPPIEHMDDCNLNQYSLQLNLYKFILQKNYGLEISGMFLVIMHPNNTTYIKIDIKCMQKEISWLLEERKNQMFIQESI